MYHGMDNMIIKEVVHRTYKHFSAAFDRLTWDQCDSLLKGFLLPGF